MKKNNRILFSCAAYCAWQCLKEEAENARTVTEAAEVISEMLIQKGVQGFSLDDCRTAFIQEILRILLNEANANFGYPHTDAAIETSLLPLWTRQFGRLERPLELVAAFDGWIRDHSIFPSVMHILNLLPAQRRYDRMADEPEGERTPGFGRMIFEKFMEEQRAWKREQLAAKSGKAERDGGSVIKFREARNQ